jgi:AraC-like DNA-binding protein
MPALPNDLTDRPKPPSGDEETADLLSVTLSRMRLKGERVAVDWLEAGQQPPLARGSAWLLIVRAGGIGPLETGDLLLLPHGIDFPGAPSLSARDATELLTCRFRFEPDLLPGMVSALPDWVHITSAEGGGWLEGLSHFMQIETVDIQPGASLMMARLIDLAVIRALRTWVHRGGAAGWLGGLSDPRIARALKLVHAEPFRGWSLEELSQLAGMSRSSFCARFQELIGESPSRYRNRLRLAEARNFLRTGQGRVGDIALAVGYESEASFSRAYKAQFGVPPANDLIRASP